MEMSSVAPRAAHPIRGPHGGWQKQEIEVLEQSVNKAVEAGESLRSVFERLAQELGRKPNSIRNFYYAQIRSQEEENAARPLPFETFAPEEVEQLVESVLTARARGLSVRACVRNLAQGDRTLMLRYQNKYRSTVRTKPELVRRVMQRLDERGVPYVSPFDENESFEPLPPRSEQSMESDPRVAALYAAIDDLVARAYPSPQESSVFPADSEAQRKADRLAARCDMLRIELADEKNRRDALQSEAEGMVSMLKEYIALPEPDRLSHCAVFCKEATQRLSAMEAAIMEEQ